MLEPHSIAYCNYLDKDKDYSKPYKKTQKSFYLIINLLKNKNSYVFQIFLKQKNR